MTCALAADERGLPVIPVMREDRPVLAFRVGRAVVGAAAVSAVTLAQLGLPSPTFWQGRSVLLYLAVGVLVLLALEESASSIAGLAQLRKLRLYEQDMRVVLSASLTLLTDRFKVPWDRVGSHAFWIRGFWRFRQLVNVGGLRIGAEPAMAKPRWKPGKGVVGAAFERRTVVAIDWAAVFSAAELAGASSWDSATVGARFGLSWGELMRTRAYGCIAACPVFDRGGRIVGVVAIDAPLSSAELGSQDLRSILWTLAEAVDELGPPPRTWWRYSK